MKNLQQENQDLKTENELLKLKKVELTSQIQEFQESESKLKAQFQADLKQMEEKKLQLEKELAEMELMSKKFISDNFKLENRINELEEKYEKETIPEEQRPKDWEKDSGVQFCPICTEKFTQLRRKHHCRRCGRIFCGKCANKVWILPQIDKKNPSRVCDLCYSQLELITK